MVNSRVGEVNVPVFPCSVKMGTLVEPALLLLLWHSVWAFDVPLEGECVTKMAFCDLSCITIDISNTLS